MATNEEQIPSRRTANQRDVVRNKNQASGRRTTHNHVSDNTHADFQHLTLLRCRPVCKQHSGAGDLLGADLCEGLDTRRTSPGSAAELRRPGWWPGLGGRRTGGRTRDSELQGRTQFELLDVRVRVIGIILAATVSAQHTMT